jgi:archaeal type IV pilus assembly protein PilA
LKKKIGRGGAGQKMRAITKLRRSTRGLSPIFATLILIAIAVIAGIIVYMFTSGTLAAMMGGGTAGQEKVAVQGVNKSSTPPAALAQNTGSDVVTISGWAIKDANGNIVSQNAAGYTAVSLNAGVVTSVPITLPSGSGSFTVTLISQKGGSFVSPSFTMP